MLGLLICGLLAEVHPPFKYQKCTKSGCTDVNSFIVADRHIENNWNRDQADGKPGSVDLDYKQIGVTTNGGTLTQTLVNTWNGQKVVGSRLYILAADEQNYEMFNFCGKEFTYTVDLSEIPCAVNAALYTIEMPKNGVDKRDGNNGAAWGYGYCDANCVDGACCPEFDIQEANSQAMVFTTHNCERQGTGQNGWEGCDSSGCGWNKYRDENDHAFWGTTVKTNQPVTVVTQFIGTGNSITEIRRLYVQGGQVIQGGSLTDAKCNRGQSWNNLNAMGQSFARGHVISFSLWDGSMSWLDGGNAGPCANDDVNAAESQPGRKVVWSNVKFGDIDSTY